jgi:hypothetical protein
VYDCELCDQTDALGVPPESELKLDPLDLPLPLPEPEELPLDEPLPDPDEPDGEPNVSKLGASLWVQAPSARNMFVPGTWIDTVRTTPERASSEAMRSSASPPPAAGTMSRSPISRRCADAKPHSSPRR